MDLSSLVHLVDLYPLQGLVHLEDLENLLDPDTPVVQVLNLEHLVHPLDQGHLLFHLQDLCFPELLVNLYHLEPPYLHLVLLVHLVNQ